MYRGVACHSKPAMPEPECTAETFPSGFTIASVLSRKCTARLLAKRAGNDGKVLNKLQIKVDGAPPPMMVSVRLGVARVSARGGFAASQPLRYENGCCLNCAS